MILFGKKTSCFVGSIVAEADSGMPFSESRVPGMGMLYFINCCMSVRNFLVRSDS